MIDNARLREHAKRYTSAMRFRAQSVKRCAICRALISALGGYQCQRIIEWHNGVEVAYIVTCLSHYCRARAAKGEV